MDRGCFGRAMGAGLIGLLLVVTACGLVVDVGGSETGTACSEGPAQDELLGDREVPQLVGLSPDEAAERLAKADISATWRYYYTTNPPSRSEGYSECWCIAPPDGSVMDVAVEPGTQVIVTVQAPAPMPGGRPQPERGWGCEGITN